MLRNDEDDEARTRSLDKERKGERRSGGRPTGALSSVDKHHLSLSPLGRRYRCRRAFRHASGRADAHRRATRRPSATGDRDFAERSVQLRPREASHDELPIVSSFPPLSQVSPGVVVVPRDRYTSREEARGWSTVQDAGDPSLRPAAAEREDPRSSLELFSSKFLCFFSLRHSQKHSSVFLLSAVSNLATSGPARSHDEVDLVDAIRR